MADGVEGDHGYRSRILANELGAYVIAYERFGTGSTTFDLGAHSAVQPPNYIGNAARTASQLSRVVSSLPLSRVMLLGASAAGTDALALARTEVIRPQAIAVFDPIGTRSTTWKGGFLDWARHQRDELVRPPSARNQHPVQPPHSPMHAVASAMALGRLPAEMWHYGNVWRSTFAFESLSQLIRERRYGSIALHGVFPAKTFTSLGAENQLLVQSLQAESVAADRAAPTSFTVGQEQYHSWTDDPYNVAQLARTALEMLHV